MELVDEDGTNDVFVLLYGDARLDVVAELGVRFVWISEAESLPLVRASI